MSQGDAGLGTASPSQLMGFGFMAYFFSTEESKYFQDIAQ